MLLYFLGFCQRYKWTLEEVQEMFLDDLLEITVVNDRIENPSAPVRFIEDIL